MSSDLPSEGQRLIDLLLATYTLEEFLKALTVRALDDTPAAHGCSITVRRGEHYTTVANAGCGPRTLEGRVYVGQDGPCRQALGEGREIVVSDLLEDRRWGPYPPLAAALGSRSVVALPLIPSGRSAGDTDTAGALTLYADLPDGFAGTGLDPLRALACQTAGAIALAQRLDEYQQFATDLQSAIRSRAHIDQAIGVVMAQRKCSAEDALAILRKVSQNSNRKLREVCMDLLTGLGGNPPAPAEVTPRTRC